MKLPVDPPVLPMLAKRLGEVPTGEGYVFEPKWDGFRTLVFRDGAEIMLQSRDEKPMNRYFPELEAPLLALLPEQCVLDGEVVLVTPKGLDFELLQQRLHPAASRVKMLSKETPVSIVFFDLLAEGEEDLRATPFAERRARLEKMLAKAQPPIHLTPATSDRDLAIDWFQRFEGAGLDGVMAKATASLYEPNKRTMFKVKHERTCDAVVAGFRWHKNGENELIGSLLLGLFDDEGRLHHVGVTASFTAEKRRELATFLEPYRKDSIENHPWKDWANAQIDFKKPGMQSRWSRGKTMEWEPVRPELVCEVAYDHMQGSRFRHTAQFRRWRHDKPPSECRFDQLEVTPPYELEAIFAAGR